jgi:hypothetical protein
MMNKETLAALLNGRQYLEEISKPEEQAAKAAGLVVVLGSSDDGVAFHGAIDDDVPAYDGCTVSITPAGLLQAWESFHENHFHESEFKAYFDKKALGTHELKAVWAKNGQPWPWLFETSIPHATFDIFDDGEEFCRGIVFQLSQLEPTTQASLLTEDPDHGEHLDDAKEVSHV